MPELNKFYAHLNDMPEHELKNKKEVLLESANGDFRNLDDDAMSELLAITRVLTKKATTPTGRKRTAPKEKKEDLDAVL